MPDVKTTDCIDINGKYQERIHQ